MSETGISRTPDQRELIAYVLPMLLFVLLLGLRAALKSPAAELWLATPEFWIYPLQTLLCGGVLLCFRRNYELPRARQPLFTIAIALLVFALWVAPQQFFGFPPRLLGFNPDTFSAQPALYWSTIVLRFLRLVVVVPLVEEIFWRGFLLRYLISEKFLSVPFGAFSWFSSGVVTLGFGLSHSLGDWPVALLASALYNFVAYRTKSLTSCIVAHSLTNLLLGLWLVTTRQWGFW